MANHPSWQTVRHCKSRTVLRSVLWNNETVFAYASGASLFLPRTSGGTFHGCNIKSYLERFSRHFRCWLSPLWTNELAASGRIGPGKESLSNIPMFVPLATGKDRATKKCRVPFCEELGLRVLRTKGTRHFIAHCRRCDDESEGGDVVNLFYLGGPNHGHIFETQEC